MNCWWILLLLCCRGNSGNIGGCGNAGCNNGGCGNESCDCMRPWGSLGAMSDQDCGCSECRSASDNCGCSECRIASDNCGCTAGLENATACGCKDANGDSNGQFPKF